MRSSCGCWSRSREGGKLDKPAEPLSMPAADQLIIQVMINMICLFFSWLLFVCSICFHPSSVVWSEVIVAEKLRHLLFSITPLSCGQTFTIPDVGIFCLKPNTFLMILVSCLSWSDAIKVLLLNIFLHGKPCQFTRFLIKEFSKSKIFTN